MLGFLKKPLVIISLLVIVIVVGAYLYFSRPKPLVFDSVVVAKTDLRQEVSITGKVKPIKDANLAFEKGGTVVEVLVDVGDDVDEGDVLVRLRNDELKAQLAQAWAKVSNALAQLKQYQAAVETEQAKLDEMLAGTRAEEVQVSERKVITAQKELDDARINLENVKQKADASLQEDYDALLTTAAESLNKAENALYIVTDIQFVHFLKADSDSTNVANAKKDAVFALLGEYSSRAGNEQLMKMDGGAKASVRTAQANPTNENVDQAASDIKNAMQKVRAALEAIPLISFLSTTEKTNLSTEKTTINTQLVTLSGKQQAIIVQNATNQSSIATAEASINDAENALALTRDELTLKKAPTTPEQIASQRAKIRQADANEDAQRAVILQQRADVQNIQAQIDKTALKSPITAVVSLQDAKVGEAIAANTIVVSLISQSKFKIESNVPEADIAKIKLNNPATLTLDAYGQDEMFVAWISKIDPGETVVEGVTTYKVEFTFAQEDPRIRSSMTANIDVLTNDRKDVLAVPQRAVTTKNGVKTVRIVVGEEFVERQVVTGLISVDGLIEITKGLNEGDQVVTFIEEPR